MRRALVTTGLMALTIGLCGCNAASGTGEGPSAAQDGSQGRIQGRLIASGGPYGTPNSPLAGVVTITSTAGDIVTVQTSTSGSFNAAMKPGTYDVTGTSPQYNGGKARCFTVGLVVVTAGEQVSADVICNRK